MNLPYECREWAKAFKEVWQGERSKVKENPFLWIGLVAAFLYALLAFLK